MEDFGEPVPDLEITSPDSDQTSLHADPKDSITRKKDTANNGMDMHMI